jgi:hypothetical protein
MDKLDTIFTRVRTLYEIDDELRRVEDDYLEEWLEEGLPDGDGLPEIMEYCCNYIRDYLYWIELGSRLIAERGIEDYYESMD